MREGGRFFSSSSAFATNGQSDRSPLKVLHVALVLSSAEI